MSKTPKLQTDGDSDVHSSDLLALRHTLAGLKYLAASPSQKWGGFDPSIVLTAKSALHHIARLRAKLRANDCGEARRAKRVQHEAEQSSRRRLQHAG